MTENVTVEWALNSCCLIGVDL